MAFTIGLDYGTNSVRALIVDVRTGEEIATSVWGFAHGEAGILLDPRDPNVARQHPADYVEGAERVLKESLAAAAEVADFSPGKVIGIGVDATGSTPIPVDASGTPLAFSDRFLDHPAAMAWLWKDHTSHAEAAAFTALAAEKRPEILAKCGGTYSSEWFWAKILHCKNTAPEVFEAAHTWVECPDWIPAFLCGVRDPAAIKRCACAAGHKGAYNPDWGGYPDAAFLAELDPALAELRATLPDACHAVGEPAGGLSAEWAEKTGLPAGIPVSVAAIDAHLGAVGCGIQPGALVRIMGTSTCDMIVHPLGAPLEDIPGICGIVPGSILPDAYGLEAGQSASGDIYNWFVNSIQPGGPEAGSHAALTEGAAALRPGESGLLALDWNNGNRTVLVDPRLTGLMLGMTLHTKPAEMYRALIEATAFGARMIMERFEAYGVPCQRVIACGGIAVKNPLVMQIHADVMNRTLEVSRSEQTCALGSAMAAAVAAGPNAGGYAGFGEAARAMTGIRPEVYRPNPEAVAIYDRLHALYKTVHDAFGLKGAQVDTYPIMKELLAIREEAAGA